LVCLCPHLRSNHGVFTKRLKFVSWWSIQNLLVLYIGVPLLAQHLYEIVCRYFFPALLSYGVLVHSMAFIRNSPTVNQCMMSSLTPIFCFNWWIIQWFILLSTIIGFQKTDTHCKYIYQIDALVCLCPHLRSNHGVFTKSLKFLSWWSMQIPDLDSLYCILLVYG
jgi:hypothetical protein